MGVIERWANESNKTIAKMKDDITAIKEVMMDVREMKEMLKEFEKSD